MSPSFRGAEILYHNVVRKAFLSLHSNKRSYPTASTTPGYTTTTSSYARESGVRCSHAAGRVMLIVICVHDRVNRSRRESG